MGFEPRKVGNMISGNSRRKSSFNLGAAMVPVLGLIIVGVLPGYLKDLYSAYTAQLMQAYVLAGYVFLLAVFGGMAVMMFRDRAALSRTIKTFRFMPDEPAAKADGLARLKNRSRQDSI